MSRPNWTSLVTRHARATGASNLPVHAINELAAHLEDIYLAALAEGRSEAEAVRAAEQALADSSLSQVPRSRSRIPESRVEPAGRGITGLAGDLRSAWRQVKGAPSIAAVAILTLGLGAGAATAIFSIVDAVLLRPLPYREPQQLVTIWDTNAEKGLSRERISPVTFMDERGLAAVFADAAAWWRPEVTHVLPGSEPVRISTIETSANLFDVLGVSTQFGPGFPKDGPLFSKDQIAVISDRLWRTRFNGDPAIVGKDLAVNDGHYTIAGVMPAGFNFPDDVDVWLRLQWDLTQHSRGAHFMEAVARLKPGVTTEQAGRELTQLSARLGEQFANTNRGWIARPVPLLDDMLGYYRPALFVLLGAVALLLLTACLNVASLLLARATVRAREMAVRAALGASRARLVRQMLVESLLLAGAGTLAGAAGALGMLKLAIASAPVAIPRLAHVTPDLRLLGFALAVVGGTAIAFGLLPALVLARTDAADALKHGSRGTTGVRGHRWNRLLVVAEVALACAVLVASALLVRSVTRMIAAPIGVVADGVVTGTLQVNSTAYRDWPSVAQFYDTLLTSIRQQPGVEAAGASNAIPLEAGWRLSFTIEGRPAPSPADRPVVQHVSITPGYLEAFRATVTGGRALAASDRRDTEPVVIVNESFAKKFFPGESAVGRRLVADSVQIGPLGRNLPGRVPFRIVGVVADLHQAPLGQAPEPVVYNAVDQFPFRAMTVVVRGADVATVSSAIRTSLHALDPTMPVSGLKTIHARVLDHTAAPRLLMFVLTAFALLTGVLAAIGVYGLLACVVTERRRELAIRLALGAQPSALAAMVTRQGLLLTSIGIVAGVCAAQLAGTALTRVLFETRPTDAVALIAAAGLLLAATLVACVPPAIRAARVEPVDGLRGDG